MQFFRDFLHVVSCNTIFHCTFDPFALIMLIFLVLMWTFQLFQGKIARIVSQKIFFCPCFVARASLQFSISYQHELKGAPIMIIGRHELKGSIEQLKQPFVVMKKIKPSKLSNAHGSASDIKQHNVSYEIAGIIKQKMLFKQYPKCIMRSWISRVCWQN